MELTRTSKIRSVVDTELHASLHNFSQKGQTPLMIASDEGYAACAKALISKGADVNATNMDDSVNSNTNYFSTIPS